MASSTLEWIGTGAFCSGVVTFAGASWFLLARDAARRQRLLRQARRRSRLALTAATDAALDNEAFEPAEILDTVDEIVGYLSAIWDESADVVSARPDASVIEVWAETVKAHLGGEIVIRRTQVDFLRVVNRPGELEDRLVLRVRLRLRFNAPTRQVGDPRAVTADLRWTLGREGPHWRLLSIDDSPLSKHLLNAPLVPAAWADDDRLWEEALTELADLEGPPAVDLEGLVSDGGSASERLAEIGQVDPRFGEALLSARLARIVEAWGEAAEGSAEVLDDLVTPDAQALLLREYRWREPLRLIVHDATVDSWSSIGLSLSGTPRLTIELVVSAVRYLVSDRTGAWAAGDTGMRHEIPLTWTLALDPARGGRWHLTASSSPTDRIPGVGPAFEAT